MWVIAGSFFGERGSALLAKREGEMRKYPSLKMQVNIGVLLVINGSGKCSDQNGYRVSKNDKSCFICIIGLNRVFLNMKNMGVVYFDQQTGAPHAVR